MILEDTRKTERSVKRKGRETERKEGWKLIYIGNKQNIQE